MPVAKRAVLVTFEPSLRIGALDCLPTGSALARSVRILQNRAVMTMHVRDFREADRLTLIALWSACGLTRPWNDPNDDFDRSIEAREATILVGHVGDQLAGSVMAGHDGHRGWVYYLAVDLAFQGRGLGRELMEEAGLWLQSRGAPKLELMVREGNESAEKFYEALGFERQQVTVYGKWLNDTAQAARKKAS